MVLADAQWVALEPLVEACRPRGKTLPSYLRRTLEAMVWRCTNGRSCGPSRASLGLVLSVNSATRSGGVRCCRALWAAWLARR